MFSQNAQFVIPDKIGQLNEGHAFSAQKQGQRSGEYLAEPDVEHLVEATNKNRNRDATMINLAYRHHCAVELGTPSWDQVDIDHARLHARRWKRGTPLLSLQRRHMPGAYCPAICPFNKMSRSQPVSGVEVLLLMVGEGSVSTLLRGRQSHFNGHAASPRRRPRGPSGGGALPNIRSACPGWRSLGPTC
jgi:hypothetical protein